MPAGNPTALSLISRFVATAKPPDDARARALAAVIDTIGVAIAGSTEPAAEIVRRTFGPVDRTKNPWTGPTNPWTEPLDLWPMDPWTNVVSGPATIARHHRMPP